MAENEIAEAEMHVKTQETMMRIKKLFLEAEITNKENKEIVEKWLAMGKTEETRETSENEAEEFVY